MLQSMRHLAQSWIFKGLMGFLVLSFGIWGIGDIFRGNPLQRAVVHIGEHNITVQAVTQEFQQQLSYARSNYMPDLTAAKAKELGLLSKSVDTLIERALRDQASHDLGIKTSLTAALDQLAKNPAFNKDGKFDRAGFEQFLKQAQFSEQDLLNGVNRELLQSAMTSAPATPNMLVENLFKAQGQKRILEIVQVAPSPLKKAEPTVDEVKAYYELNIQKFNHPEQRTLTIASLNSDELAKDIIITDEQVKQAYDSDAAGSAKPETRDLLQVITQDETTAKTLADKAKNGGDLKFAAKEMGLATTALDHMEQSGLPPELGAPLFSLPEKSVSAPLKTNLGWHVIKIVRITPSTKPDLKSASDALRKKLQQDRAADMIGGIVNRLEDQLAAGKSLEDIAQDIKLSIETVSDIDATGAQHDGKTPLVNNPNLKSILHYGFSQQGGEVSTVLDDRAGHYVVVRTDSVNPSAAEPLEKIRDQVIAAIAKEEQSKATATRADAIAKALKEGKSVASLAAEKGITVRLSRPISESGDNDDTLPATIYTQVLNLKKGETLVTEKDDHHLVLRLAEIKEVSEKEDSEGKGYTAIQVNMNAQNEALFQYMNYLRRTYNVKIDHEALASVAQTDNP